MLRMLTAGESHGKALVAVLEGMPAGVPVTPEMLDTNWRGGATVTDGVGGRSSNPIGSRSSPGCRHGRTLGSPIAVTIPNLEFDAKYADLMGVEGEMDPAKRLTRPRPGHADLAGAQKYGFDDVRNVLERASARETAARVTIGVFCKALLGALDVQVISHVVQIASIKVRRGRGCPMPDDLASIDRSPVRCADPDVSARMVAEIDRLRKDRDTVGGVFEVLAYGAPPGLGSYVHYDRKLDGRLARALMSIQSVKGVEVGDGFATAARPGSKAHDEIVVTRGHDRQGDATRRRDRGRHEHRWPHQAAGRDEAVLHGAQAAGDGRHRDWGACRRDQAAHRCLRRAGRRCRGRGRRRVRARRRRPGEVRRRFPAGDPAEPGSLPGGVGVIVYLVGMPGAGKTVVGRELAGRLGVPFMDLDAEIERDAGKPVAEIFADGG